MESDRGLVKMPSLAKKSMTFMRDVYALASSSGPTFQTSPTTQTQQSFQPSQGLSHHFNQTHQSQPYLKPHTPLQPHSWPGPLGQSMSSPGGHSNSHPSHPPASPSSQQQKYHHYPPLPPPPPPPPPLPPRSPSQSLPAVSPVTSGPTKHPHPQWSAPSPTNVVAPPDNPPPYHQLPAQPNLVKPTLSVSSQHSGHQQKLALHLKPVAPLQVFSPDCYHEIYQSESANNVGPTLPPRPATASPSPHPSPPQQQYHPVVEAQHTFIQETPPEHGHPAYIAPQYQQQSYGQQFYHTPSPVSGHQPSFYPPEGIASPAQPFTQSPAPYPQHSQTWPQPHGHQQQPHSNYFNHHPAPAQISSSSTLPALSVSPPIAELPTHSPTQAHHPPQQITHHPYHQQYQQRASQQSLEYAAYQAYAGGHVMDNKPPILQNGHPHITTPAIAELPG